MTSTIIIKTDPKLKREAQKIASDLGITLTAIINSHLRDFVEKKSISLWSRYKKVKNPYGIFKDSKITEADIDEVTHSWDKIIDELA